MMKSMILMVGAFVASSVFGTSLYDEQIGSILADMTSTNIETRLNVTNRLNALIASVTNREQLATCRLLKAKLRIECEDITRDERIYDYYAFHDATNLCWKVRNTFSPSENAWQFYGATLLLPVPLSMDNQHQVAYAIATNALATLDTYGEASLDEDVWPVLFSQEALQQGNMRIALQTLAAITLSFVDITADITSYTNGLPAQAIQMINGIRSKRGN